MSLHDILFSTVIDPHKENYLRGTNIIRKSGKEKNKEVNEA